MGGWPMSSKALLGFIAAAAVLAVGCGGDDDTGAGSTSGGSCADAATTPTVLQLADVQPAAGASVPNEGIVHAFTVVQAPGLFQSFTFVFNPAHTANTSDPVTMSFTVTQQGADIRYQAAPVSWAEAPSRVDLRVAERYQGDGACYVLPDPLFAYDVVPAGGGGGAGGAGGGGQGGSGGQGGTGG